MTTPANERTSFANLIIADVIRVLDELSVPLTRPQQEIMASVVRLRLDQNEKTYREQLVAMLDETAQAQRHDPALSEVIERMRNIIEPGKDAVANPRRGPAP